MSMVMEALKNLQKPMSAPTAPGNPNACTQQKKCKHCDLRHAQAEKNCWELPENAYICPAHWKKVAECYKACTCGCMEHEATEQWQLGKVEIDKITKVSLTWLPLALLFHLH